MVHPQVITSAGETVEGFNRKLSEMHVRPIFAEARLEDYLAKNPWDITHSDIDYSHYHGRMDTPANPEERFAFMGALNCPGTPTFESWPMRCPLDRDITLEDVAQYPWFAAEKHAVAKWNGETYQHWAAARRADDQVVLGRAGHPFEWSWFIRGYERLMMDLATGSEVGGLILHKVTERACDYARFFAANGADAIYMADDVATQRGLMMSPEMFGKWIKPMYRKIIESARAIKPDIFFVLHCCGNCQNIIEDYIDLGLDLLNPLQPEAMDVTRIYHGYRDRLSFWRGLGVQSTMAKGSVWDVRSETEKLIEMARGKGGLIIGPSHSIEPGTPLENVYAYVETASRYVGQI